MFGVGPWELAAIAVVGLVIFGPEKLPKMAADAARLVRDLRRMAASARQDLTEALGTELPDLDLGDLNPRSFLKGNVLDLLDDTDPRPTNGSGSGARGPRGASGGPPNDALPGGRTGGFTTAGDGDDGRDATTADDATTTPDAGPSSYDADTT